MSQKKSSSAISTLKLRHAATASTREDDVPAVWDIGDVVLNLYEVKDVFWPGGQGLVYRVHHREWDIDLAVKSPRETPFETTEETEAFLQAADAWFDLGLFPHIVSCYYVRKLGGIPRLFLEFIEGGSLHSWIQTRRLYAGGAEESLKRILDLAIQFAWGLQYAHEQNLIHGEVKPSNLMLTTEGVAKVKGFGFTTEHAGKSSAEDQDTATGSAFYAPERAGRQKLTRRTDIWSWAASVLEMFTGELRWREGEISDVALENYLEQEARDDDIPHMPVAVAELLRECLHSNPAQRPGGMAEVADGLRQIYKQQTGSDHPRPLPVQANIRADDLNNRALSLLDLERTDEALWIWDEALVLKPQQVEATYNSGLVRWRMGRITDQDLLRTLEALKHSEPDEGFINYLLSRVHLERDDAKASFEALGNVEEINDDADEATEALSLRQNQGLQSDRPLTVFCNDEIYGPNCFSPDGKSLLLTVSGPRGPRIRVLDLTDPRSPRYLEGHTKIIHAITLSANGRYALTSSADETVRLWDVQTAECLQTMTYDRWPYPDVLGLSADGRHAVLGFEWKNDESSLKLWDAKAGHWIRDFETTMGYGAQRSIQSLSMSPDARYVLSGSDCGVLQLWDVSTGKVLRDLHGLGNYVRFAQFSADGTSCFAANNYQLKQFDISTGECLNTVTVDEDDERKISRITVSADGNYALFGSTRGELRLWETKTGRCVRTFQDLSIEIKYDLSSYEAFTSIKLSADGRYLLTGTRGETYKLWRFNPDYRAPLILSRVLATEEALTHQTAAEENLALARTALAENHFVAAANYVRAARSVPGYERSAEAVELWTSLYLHLPRTQLKASWHSHEVEGQELSSSISFSTDARYVLFGGFNMELREVATGKCLRVFDKAMRGNTALSGDARLAMIGGWEDYELWDTVTGKLINKLPGFREKHVKDIRVSADGKYGVSCTEETLNFLKLTPEGLSYLPSTTTDWGTVSAVAISPDNKYCVTGTGYSKHHDYDLRLWEIPSGKCIRKFSGYDSGTYTLVFTPDNKHFLGAGFDGTLRLWQVATGKCVRLFEGHTQPVDSVDISSDGNYALSGGRDGKLKMWDMATADCIRTWDLKADFVGPVRFSSDGKYVLFGVGRTVSVEILDWELEDREPRDWDEGARPYLETFLLLRAATSNKGIPAWSDDDFRALLHQLGCAGLGWLRAEGVRRELEKRAAELAPKRSPAEERFADNVAVSHSLPHDEQYGPGAISNPASMDLWTKRCLEAPQNSVRSVAAHEELHVSPDWTDPAPFDSTPEQPVVFSRNQELVASCFHRTLRLWDSRTGEILRDLGTSINRLECASFSKDGRFIATGTVKESIKVWEVANGGCVATFPTEDSRHEAICFSQNGTLLSSGAWDGTVKVWSIEKNELVHVMKGHDDTITTIDFSPDGKLLASGSWDRTVKLWDLETGDCVRMLPDHNTSVGMVCFSPDGNLIATCNRDKYQNQDKHINLWDTKTGELVQSLQGHEGTILSFAFSLHGPFLVSAGEDATARIWDVRRAECLHAIDAALGNVGRSNKRFAHRIEFTLDGQHILYCRGQRDWVERIVWSGDWESEGNRSENETN